MLKTKLRKVDTEKAGTALNASSINRRKVRVLVLVQVLVQVQERLQASVKSNVNELKIREIIMQSPHILTTGMPDCLLNRSSKAL